MLEKLKTIFASSILKASRSDEKPSPEQIRAYLQKNAKDGSVEDQFRYGVLCLDGCGGPINIGHGIYWLNQAANQGNAEAQYLLGTLLYEGHLIEKDSEKSCYWLSLAFANGKSEANCYLNKMRELAHATGPILGKQSEE